MLGRIKRKINRFIEERKVNKLVTDVANEVVVVQEQQNVAEDKPYILCLLRNGAYFIPSFMQHHSSLGFENFVFIDNDSDDDSREMLAKYNVTILRSKLPYGTYKWAFKQYLVKEYAEEQWSLYVDIDELWDYPYSSSLSLQDFFEYLDLNDYTAVQAHMLDMFANKPLKDLKDLEGQGLKRAYPYYDNSGLLPKKYSKAYNKISNPDTRHYWGGVHNSIFGIDNIYISKLPLVKWNPLISVHETSHTSTHVHIADVSTVLLHYKFVLGFYEKAERIIKEGNYWNASETYKKYLDHIERDPDKNLFTENSSAFTSAEALVEEGFLMESQKYVNFVKSRS